MKALTQADIEQMLNLLAPDTVPTKPPANTLTPKTSSAAHELEEVRDALTFISPDCPRGSGSILDGNDPSPEGWWAGTLWAIRRHLGEDGKDIARSWSMQARHRYDAQGFEQTWKQGGEHASPVSIASVFKLARLSGWRGLLEFDVLEDPKTGFRLLDRAAIMALPQMRWRVKGIFPETGIGAIYGPSKAGKSFLSFDLGCAIAGGQSWFGHRTVQAAVTYVMLEGQSALRNRLQAWEMHNEMQLPAEFRALNQAFNLSDPDQVKELSAHLPKSGVVIIDTLNRAAPGLDENSSQDMGRILDGMRTLQDNTEGLVLIVHHTGKDAKKGLRGHSSLLAALDGAIEVERTQSSRIWSTAKVKDGDDDKHVGFKLEIVKLGVDSDLDPIISCAVAPDNVLRSNQKEPKGSRQGPAYRKIKLALGVSETKGVAGAKPDQACITFSDAGEAVLETLTGLASNKRRNSAREIVQQLVDRGYLRAGFDEDEEQWIWL